MERISIPAYYKDKEGREAITNRLETQIHQIMDIVLSGKTDQQLNSKVSDLFSLRFAPKTFDDTKFVVVSRFHVAITAMQIWQMKFATGKECEIMHTPTVDVVEKFIKEVYLPYCLDLQESLLHRWNNHGSLALMGECIARKYMSHHAHKLNVKLENRLRLKACGAKLAERVDKNTLDKDGCLGKKYEFWAENLRNKKGLFYTYLNLSALVRTMVTLMNEKVIVSDVTKGILHRSYQNYLKYFYEPNKWPYMEPTKIPILRQLQKLLFPADKFVEPRINGKEGAFMDVCANRVYSVTSPPFMNAFTYKELGPFPYSTQIMESAHNLWGLL